MADWVLIPSLVALRDTFNRHCPSRDKASDGSIGDPAHAASSSDHNPDETGTAPIRDADTVNEVHAIDVDEDLRATDARGPFTMMRAVRQIITDCRAGRERRLRYVIYERTIWSASWGWTAREYTGANPHDKHAHFSGSYDSARERDAGPWDIGWEDPVTEAEIAAIAQRTKEKILADGGVQYLIARSHAAISGASPVAKTGETNLLHAKLDAITQSLAAAGSPLTADQVQALTEALTGAVGTAVALALETLVGRLRAAAQAEADALN